MVKYLKKISVFKYLLMFDLASKTSGVCLWNLQDHKPEFITHFTVQESNKVLHGEAVWQSLDEIFQYITVHYCSLSELFVGKEAMPQQMHGRGSTVQTLLALARTHSILDLYLVKHNIEYYDDIGIYPITTHAYLKHLNGWDNKHKVDKEDIHQYVEKEFSYKSLTYDESDSVFLAQTLIDHKWNRDLCDKIKENNRHIKTLKSEHAIIEWTHFNDTLEQLKI